MKIFLLGARGFIGSRIAEALERDGHEVTRAGRPQVDLARDHDPAAWKAAIAGSDVAINAAGILEEKGGATLEAVHAEGPIALFTACAQQGIRVIQLSALGADADAPELFLATKHRADAALLAMDVPSVVLQPSLVYGPGGASARLFSMLASLPVIPLPGDGGQRVQPVHVEDVAQAVTRIVETGHFPRTRMALVGPAPLTLREFLRELRAALGLGRARFLPVPEPLVTLAARLRLGLLDRDTWAMLRRGNTASPEAIRAALGHAPRAASRFVAPAERRAAAAHAKLGWLLPLLRVALAAVWLTAGVVSLGVYPIEDSLALLARTHITGTAAYVALYGAAALDVAFGIATLVLRRRRWLWAAQAAVILAYTAIITAWLPEQWLHPYGPVVKNLPILAALAILHALEER